jgi:hypothetical protein
MTSVRQTPDWIFADGWILMAIVMQSHQAAVGLDKIIAAADAINHAIPTHEELTSSLTKLVSVGVVAFEPHGLFRVTADHAASLRQALAGRGGMFRAPDKGLLWLQCNPLSVQSQSEIVITNQQVQQAYRVYTQTHR